VDLETLRKMVADDAALRRRQRLQPVGGVGDKIFPPTYPGEGPNAPPRHVFERRRLGDEVVWCALVDSVQSQANRLEECLKAASDEGRAEIPQVVVDFRGRDLIGVATVSSLEAPHRVYDAILRDSLLEGRPFMESEVGRRLAAAKPEDASALLEISPTALLFGSWHSTGSGGGLGAKFARCLVSEVIAVDVPVEFGLADNRGRPEEPRTAIQVIRVALGLPADEQGRFGEPRTAGRRTGSRIDPLGVLRKVEVYKSRSGWAMTPEEAGRDARKVRPSEINHGNIPPTVQALGVTCAYLEHTFVLSFAALRRLRFGSSERDQAARAYLAALGLLALAEQDARGYALRSRCDLVCEGRAELELVRADGSTVPVDLDRDGALRLYQAALAETRRAGLQLRTEPLRLQPQDKLVELVRRSQQLALAGEGGEADEER
jgi:CRISPR-associated protein Csb1